MTQITLDHCHQPVAKVIQEFLYSHTLSLMFAPASPFVGQFEKLMQIFIQSGLSDKWLKMKFLETSYQNGSGAETCETRGSEATLNFQILSLVLIGYFASIIVEYSLGNCSKSLCEINQSMNYMAIVV